jgi:DNA-binding NarL/FixJ family response regulator
MLAQLREIAEGRHLTIRSPREEPHGPARGTTRRPSAQPPAVLTVVAASSANGAGETTPMEPGRETLTLREQEVVALVAEGLSNREIAWKLHISTSTVIRHVANIMQKLDMHTRTQIAIWDMRSRTDAASDNAWNTVLRMYMNPPEDSGNSTSTGS